MYQKYSNEEIEEMVDAIETYDVEHDDCERICCEDCCFLEDCYNIAKDRENSQWAKLINYGGCDTEEEFWEQLLN